MSALSYKVQFATYMQLGGSTLMLTGGNTTGNQTYSGSLLSGGTPFDLKTLANKIMGVAFDLTLPASFPTITVDSLSATVTGTYTPATTNPVAPEKTVWSYAFQATSTASVTQPFGDSVPVPVSFQGFSIAVNSCAGTVGTALFFTTTVNSTLGWFSKMAPVTGQPVTGQLVLMSGSHAAAFFIHGNINTANLLGDLFCCTVPADLADFLPTFSPLSITQPMRLYYSSAAINTVQNNVTYNFQTGFNFDQCVVSILGLEFSISLQFSNASSYSFGASIDQIDLGILQIGAPAATGIVPNPGLGGPVVQVQRLNQKTTIDLQASLIFFSGTDKPLSLSASYTAATPTAGYIFNGNVTYVGVILGISNPSIGIAWSKADGLQITNFPLPQGALASFIAFEKELKDILNAKPGNKCAPLVDFVFSKTVTTTFKLNVKPTSHNGRPGLAIGGTYSVWVGGYDICDIVFNPFTATIAMPKNFDDLGNAIIQTLKDNATNLVQALVDNQDALAKFLAVQTLKSGAEAAVSLVCNAGGDAAADAVGEAAETATDAAAAATGDTLAGAAAAFAAAAAALSFFDQIIKCLTSSQKEKRREAQAMQAAASAKIQKLLMINGFAAHYVVTGNSITCVTNWTALGVTDPAAWLILTITDATGTVLFTSQNLTLDTSPASCNPATCLQSGQTYTLTLCGHYFYNDSIFDGLPVSQSVTINALGINSPTASSDSAANTVTATWSPTNGFLTPDLHLVSVSYYTVELWDVIASTAVAGMSANVAGNAALTHIFSLLPQIAPYFTPAAGNRYQIRLQAIANIAVFNSPVWQSPPFAVGVGIGHTLIGKSFTVG